MRTLVPDPQVIAPNFKRRLSGVTTTLFRVAPVQARSLRLAVLGPVVPGEIPQIRFRDLPRLARRPADRPFRIWHARRNVEMLAGVVLRDLLRFPMKLVFTSASQRKHTGWSRFLIGRMDAVVSVSEFTAAYLQRSSTVVMHGIDTGVFRPAFDGEARPADLPPSGRLVGCFGRIRRQKGTDVFIDAMIRVLPDRPDVKAVVLGRATGEHQGFLDALKARVAAAGLSDRILFPGEVGPLETPAYYRALSLYVAPQRWEGFGVTPLEAMASGAPVVATTVGAFPKLVIEGETGSLIPPGDVEAMAAAVARWLDDEAGRTAAGEAARRRVEAHFSLEAEAEGLNAVYRRLWDQA
ncbi:glycosyltransferase family 4 protein [Brevundimonas sp. PAMC22021]|uniref:glycosyltransferase family 4 protein n=1 Tax=Brevundimonas sp. PAMC22021 TaxID=2861285 RepID=UPI001C624AA6|nr:glycosyltransferase family 4 protein [Brevundimonas sp. PAMC22021]QYF87496.1 glycosyltransferase family 4 protein [Brevundimonas sp. PAMC22021]